MDVKLERKLAHGVMGTVYLARVGKKSYIYKLEKVDKDAVERMDLSVPFFRQIDFDKQVAQRYPKNFLTLKSWGIVNACNHRQPIPHWASGDFRKELEKKNKSTVCVFLMYGPVLQFSWEELRPTIFKSKAKYHGAVVHLLKAISVLYATNYRHGDLHAGNVMGDGKQWYIIDYGRVGHPKFPRNQEDARVADGPSDMVMALWNLFVWDHVAEYSRKHKVKWPPYRTFSKRIDTAENRAKLKPFLPTRLDHEVDRIELMALLVALQEPAEYRKALGMTAAKYRHLAVETPDIRMVHTIIKMVAT